MPQESLSIESAKVGKPVTLPSQSGGLKWKITTAFSGLLIVLGICVIGIVYILTGNALRRQVDLRSAAIASNLSDAAAGYVAKKSTLELDALIAKYGRLDGVAYAYIQGPKGDILAGSLQPFPVELKNSSELGDQRTSVSRTTNIRGKPVYETQMPILDGQLGAVHVGLWADAVQRDVRDTVLPIVALIALCLVIGIVISVIIAGRTIRPILELKSSADEISRGNLDASVSVQGNDEVGELARSLERMRASLKAAMLRLNRE
jgi:two-component system, cell cycle sensor histidine kinase and response regulator CckA